MKNDYKYMVFTKCLTFNQAQYIEQTLNGFAMQDTRYSIVFCIIDDASTDGEQDVIRKWAETNLCLCDSGENTWNIKDFGLQLVAHHKEKGNLIFNIILLAENHHGKKSKIPYYIELRNNSRYNAICEGDDYWDHPLKIQTQVEFLENHPECSMCFHAHHSLQPDGSLVERKPETDKDIFYPEDIIDKAGGFMATNSMLFRSEYLINENIPDFWKHSLVGDLPRMLFLITKGNFGYINKFMSVYRVMAKGSWSERDNKASVSQLIKKLKHNMLMYKEFDLYTEGKYSTLIEKRVKRNKQVFYIRIVKTIFRSIINH